MRELRNWGLPLLSMALLGVASYHVARSAQAKPPLTPPAAPPRSPFSETVAAVGIAEPRTEGVLIGTHVAGVVQEVFVKPGDEIESGAPLFRIDDRQVRADLAVREALLATAQAQLRKLEQSPRPEELPGSEARVHEAQARVVQQEERYQRRQQLFDKDSRVVAQDELATSRQDWLMAKQQLAKAVADHDLLRAGTWEPDLQVARATVAQHQSQVNQSKVELDRLVVKAPLASQVLRVDVRAGEYVGQPAGQVLIILGDVRSIHVRADIDEADIPRFQPNGKARGFVRGAADQPIPLEFVRVEPYVQPKRSLTGRSSERVDTRVLQVIYAIGQSQPKVRIGQQLDVYIDVSQ